MRWGTVASPILIGQLRIKLDTRTCKILIAVLYEERAANSGNFPTSEINVDTCMRLFRSSWWIIKKTPHKVFIWGILPARDNLESVIGK